MGKTFGAARLKAALCGVALLMLAGCASSSHDAATAGTVGQMTPPPASSSTTTQSSTTVVTGGTAAAKPVTAPEQSHWKMHIDDRTLICNDYDRGTCYQ